MKEAISFIDNSNDMKIEFKKKKEIYTELDDNPEWYEGRIKFFDYSKNKMYGFIEPEDGGSDMFIHKQQLDDSNIPLEFIQNNKEILISYRV